MGTKQFEGGKRLFVMAHAFVRRDGGLWLVPLMF